MVKFGARLGTVLHQLVTVVAPSTFLRWIREDKRAGRKRNKPAERGRPRTAEEIRQLVVKLAKENAWGYARIVGELKKLGLRSIKKSTVRNILKAEGLDPCPKRSGATWDEFLARHAASLWQCDFFSAANSWLDHYHAERPYQWRENELLVRPLRTKTPEAAAAVFALRNVRCRKRLGGLLKHYERVAA